MDQRHDSAKCRSSNANFGIVGPPLLPFKTLPEAEQEHAHFVWMLLGNLGSRCTEFEHALTLFDFCMSRIIGSEIEATNNSRKHSGWLHIAARAAASTTYLFHEDMEFLGKNLSLCPTLAQMIDHKAKRAATKKFSQYFPDFAGVRHSGQHYAKLYGTPEKMAENVNGPVLITSAIVDHTLQGSFEKKDCRLDIRAVQFS